MKKIQPILLSLMAVFLVGCGGGGGGGSALTAPPGPSAPSAPSAPAAPTAPTAPTTMAALQPAAAMTWATSAASVVTVQVVDAGQLPAPGVSVLLFSVQKTDPIDGSALTKDMWIRKGLLATGVTDASGSFSASVQLPTSAEHVIAVAELSTFTAGSPPVTSVRTASAALAVGTVGTLTLSSPNS